MATLERLGYVVHQGDEYHIGIGFLDHGGFALTRHPWYGTMKNRIREIVAETDELCQFAIQEQGRGTIAVREEGKHAVKTELRIGSRMNLTHFTAGKAILAAMPTNQTEAVIQHHGLPEKTSKTITDPNRLFQELKEIRQRGYVFDEEEHISGLHAIAVPLKLKNDIGAISIAGPSFRINNQRKEELANILLGVANEMELNLSLEK